VNKLTEPQRQAVLSYAHEQGRNWKQSLRDDWARADARLNGEPSPELQQVRNLLGPSWLNRVSLKDLKVEPKKAIYVLMDAVADAIREYDKSGDHTRHGPGADCIRCKLEEAIGNTFAGKPVKRSS
jgi:hypothetical protein